MKLWYDVSGIYKWSGAFTGIQRVVYNLAEELQQADVDIGFFIYVHGIFTEISFEDLRHRVEAAKQIPVVARRKDAPAERLTLRKLYYYAIVAAKRTVRGSRLEKPLRSVYSGLRGSYRAVRSGSTHTELRTPFSKGDAVLVVDGNWQFRDYAKDLLRAKAAQGFTLLHMVHDMVAVKNPAFANPGAEKIIGGYFEVIFAAADMLIAVSQSTKRDIEWFMEQKDIPHKPQMAVLIEGDNLSSSNGREARHPTAAIPKDFILAVSTIEIRKNYSLLYYVYKLARQRGVILPHLVIVGRKGWMAEEAFALLTEDTDINRQISILQGAPDAELEWLYQHCLFTVAPSFYEGWGLSVAESLFHGKACISSNSSSMPEVGKEMATYASPYSADEFLEAIRVYLDPAARKHAEEKIAAHYKLRTWKDSTDDLVALIKGFLKQA